MNLRALRTRKTVAGASLVLAGLLAGGTLASVGTANAASGGSTTSSSSSRAPGSSDTAVTGSTADQVKAAVKAKNSGVTITSVRKDPDGSYDALGTDSSGSNVFYDVSADLKTITAGGGHGGRGGHGGSQDAVVTGSEADTVTAAVKAKSSGVTVTRVRKDADGSYDALGTDASGNNVLYDVSKDLKTVTANTGPGA